MNLAHIQEHMAVEGSDGGHVGTVDHVEGNRIKLTKSDPTAGGKHHYLGTDKISSIQDNTVVLNCTASEARSNWTQESA